VLQQLESHFAGFAPSNVDQRYFAEMDLLDGAIGTLSAFSGLLMENTTRGFGWRFLEIGRRMERALQMADLLSSGLDAASTDIEPYLQVLLQIADSSITYRSRHPMVLQTDYVLQLLLVDETNPRSIGFQLATLLHQLNRLQESNVTASDGAQQALAIKALTAVRESSTFDLSQQNEDDRFAALDELIEQLKTNLWALSDSLTERYFSHLRASRLTASW
jgi:uncharacterized alpha-E superfamily protein